MNLLANINTITTNGLISINEIEKNNDESKIKVSLIRKPNNPNQEIIIRTWLNGLQKNILGIQNGNGYLFQGSLVVGENQWVSKSYLIDSRLYKTITASINQFLKEKYDIQRKLDTLQLTADEIVKLNLRIVTLGKWIDELI